MPEKAPNSFSPSAPAAEASGKARPAAAGRVHVLRPGMLERCTLHLRPARSSLPGRSAGKARRPARDMLKPGAASFPLSGFAAQRGPGINRTRRPGEKSTPRRRVPCSDERRSACPSGPASLFALRQHQSGVSLSEAATPKLQSFVRSCATNAGKGATSVAFGADVCGVHARP